MNQLLLTGFEPFGGSTINPAAEVVKRFETGGVQAFSLHTLILPVDTRRAPKILEAALLDLRPDWCVMLGEARGRPAISVERVAINVLDFQIPDNAGQQIVDEPVVPDGPAAYFCTLPVRHICEAIREAGVPAELSLSAGTYLCNQVIYVALHTAATHKLPTRCGFLHLPALPEQVARDPRRLPSMTLDLLFCGVEAALRALKADRDAAESSAAPLHLAQ